MNNSKRPLTVSDLYLINHASTSIYSTIIQNSKFNQIFNGKIKFYQMLSDNLGCNIDSGTLFVSREEAEDLFEIIWSLTTDPALKNRALNYRYVISSGMDLLKMQPLDVQQLWYKTNVSLLKKLVIFDRNNRSAAKEKKNSDKLCRRMLSEEEIGIIDSYIPPRIPVLNIPVFSFDPWFNEAKMTRIFNMDLAKKEIIKSLIQQFENDQLQSQNIKVCYNDSTPPFYNIRLKQCKYPLAIEIFQVPSKMSMPRHPSQEMLNSFFYLIYEANQTMKTKPIQKDSYLIELNISAIPAIKAPYMYELDQITGYHVFQNKLSDMIREDNVETSPNFLVTLMVETRVIYPMDVLINDDAESLKVVIKGVDSSIYGSFAKDINISPTRKSECKAAIELLKDAETRNNDKIQKYEAKINVLKKQDENHKDLEKIEADLKTCRYIAREINKIVHEESSSYSPIIESHEFLPTGPQQQENNYFINISIIPKYVDDIKYPIVARQCPKVKELMMMNFATGSIECIFDHNTDRSLKSNRKHLTLFINRDYLVRKHQQISLCGNLVERYKSGEIDLSFDVIDILNVCQGITLQNQYKQYIPIYTNRTSFTDSLILSFIQYSKMEQIMMVDKMTKIVYVSSENELLKEKLNFAFNSIPDAGAGDDINVKVDKLWHSSRELSLNNNGTSNELVLLKYFCNLNHSKSKVNGNRWKVVILSEEQSIVLRTFRLGIDRNIAIEELFKCLSEMEERITDNNNNKFENILNCIRKDEMPNENMFLHD